MSALKQTWDKNKSQVFSIIKSEYESGAELNKIAFRLNSMGLKSKNNREFSKSIVCAIALYDLNLQKRVEQSKHVFKKNTGVQSDCIIDKSSKSSEIVQSVCTDVQEGVSNISYNQNESIDNSNVQAINEGIEIDDNIVFSKDGKLVTDSLHIAKIFERRHDNIIQSIREIYNKKPEFALLNFQESSYITSQNKQIPMFYISEEGFTILAMSFTTDKAFDFKIAYIKKFNEMRDQLKPKTTIEILQGSINELARIENQVKSIDGRVENLSKDLIDLKTFKNDWENKKKYSESLLEPERSLVLPLQKETRAKVRDLVDWYVAKSIDIGHKVVWNKLYKEFLLRYKINVKARAKDKKISTLSYIESINKMEELFAIASEILVFPVPVQQNTVIQAEQMNFLNN